MRQIFSDDKRLASTSLGVHLDAEEERFSSPGVDEGGHVDDATSGYPCGRRRRRSRDTDLENAEKKYYDRPRECTNGPEMNKLTAISASKRT